MLNSLKAIRKISNSLDICIHKTNTGTMSIISLYFLFRNSCCIWLLLNGFPSHKLLQTQRKFFLIDTTFWKKRGKKWLQFATANKTLWFYSPNLGCAYGVSMFAAAAPQWLDLKTADFTTHSLYTCFLIQMVSMFVKAWKQSVYWCWYWLGRNNLPLKNRFYDLKPRHQKKIKSFICYFQFHSESCGMFLCMC